MGISWKKETRDSVVHVWQRFKGKQGGSYYAINRDHPLVEVFVDSSPQMKRNIENLLKSIETELPLSSLYLDLNSDKPVENDVDIPQQEVEVLLQELLSQITTNAGKTELLDRLAVSEPFINFPKLIEKHRTGGNINGNN